MCAEACLSLDEITLQAVEKDVQIRRLPMRAKRKAATQKLSTRLVQLLPNTPRRNQYDDAWGCSHRLIEYQECIRSWGYCHRRICTVCASIRQAHIIGSYDFHQLPDPHFVTLSARNITADRLTERIQEYEDVWRKEMQALQKKNRRQKRDKISGLRKLEITYNDTHGKWKNTYHPHFHVLISGSANAEELRATWLQYWGDEASHLAQDVRACDESTMLEMSKYETKLAITADPNSDDVVRAIDVIVGALFGKRTLQPFGDFKKHEPEDQFEKDYGEPVANWEWNARRGMWLVNGQRDQPRDYQFDRTSKGYKKVELIELAPQLTTPKPDQLRLFESKDWVWYERDGR